MVLISVRGRSRSATACGCRPVALAGQVEGVVASLGLLYTTFARGQDSIMVPNNIVLLGRGRAAARARAVDLRARLRAGRHARARSRQLLERAIETPVRGEPAIALEEVDADEVVVRIQATPLADEDGPKLADEVLAAVGAVTQDSRQADSAMADR